MNYSVNLDFLSQQNLLDAGCFNIGEAFAVIENAIKDFSSGRFLFPNKVATIFNPSNQSRINCLPSGDLNEQIYGMKWVSVFPDNPHQFDKPNLSAVILLSETKTGFPLVLMDGVLCSAMRTAGVSAVAASFLAKKTSTTIGFVGAGEQAKMHFMFFKHIFPELNKCKVSSRTGKTEYTFIEQLSKFYPQVEFIPCNSCYEKACQDSDIIVSAISGQEKILQASWITPGTFYCHVAGLEDDFAVALKADKIVCDHWESVKHRTQTISQMYQQGMLKDSDIYADLFEIVTGQKEGRESDNEFVYFNAVGLSYIDLSLASYMYKKAKSKGNLDRLKLQENNIFNVPLSTVFL